MGFRQEKGANEIGSNLGEGVELSGEFNFARGVRIGGSVKGKIKANATLEVAPAGKIEADMEVRRIAIHGEVRGTIRASERVEIFKTGKVFGEVWSPCLIIESGAIFEGRCNMMENVNQTHGGSSLKEEADKNEKGAEKGKAHGK